MLGAVPSLAIASMVQKHRLKARGPARIKTAPVWDKLERLNSSVAKPLPPDGQHQEWLDRLKACPGNRSGLSRLSGTFAILVETFSRVRNGGSQGSSQQAASGS